MIEIGEQRPLPPHRIDVVANMAVEIAIGAFRPTERPMDINGERLRLAPPPIPPLRTREG
jgi:hypothetical protein